MKNFIIITLILLVVIVSGCANQENETSTTVEAISFYETGITITSKEDVINLLNQNLDTIIASNIEFLENFDGGSFSYDPELLETLKTKMPLEEYIDIEYRQWENDRFWIPDSDFNYVATIPLVTDDEEWVFEEGEVRIYYEACPPNYAIPVGGDCPVELETTYKKATELNYLITNDGVIHFAGIV